MCNLVARSAAGSAGGDDSVVVPYLSPHGTPPPPPPMLQYGAFESNWTNILDLDFDSSELPDQELKDIQEDGTNITTTTNGGFYGQKLHAAAG